LPELALATDDEVVGEDRKGPRKRNQNAAAAKKRRAVRAGTLVVFEMARLLRRTPVRRPRREGIAGRFSMGSTLSSYLPLDLSIDINMSTQELNVRGRMADVR
jgi:hypothetical protein